MIKTKTTELLYNLSVVERNRLHKFIESPYFNVNPALIKLSFILNQLVESSSDIGLVGKEYVWQQVYPTDEYNDLKFRRLLSSFNDLIKRFLSIEEFESNPLEVQNTLLRSITKKNIQSLGKTSLKNSDRLLERSNYRNGEYYLFKSFFERNRYSIERIEVKRVTKKNTPLNTLNNVDKALDIFYLSERLRTICSRLIWKSLLQSEKEQQKTEIESVLIKVAEQQEYVAEPCVQIYLNIYHLLSDQSKSQNYYAYKRLMDESLDLFPPDQQKEIIEFAINFCTAKANAGDREFLNELLINYKRGLEYKIIEQNGVLSQWKFKNIVSSALRLKEYSWTSNFIESYKDKLPIGYRENTVILARAQLLFYQKKYEDVLPLLQQVELKEFSYNTSVKSILIASYYELEHYDGVESTALSLRLYINRYKGLSTNAKKAFKNFVKITLQLIRSDSRDTKNLIKIRDEILTSQGLASKTWLLEKVHELLGEKVKG